MYVGGQKRPKMCQRSLWMTPYYGFVELMESPLV